MKRSPQFLAAIAAYDSHDDSLALRLMEQCAEAGEPVACYMAALWRENGEGATADAGRSAYWMQRLEQLAEEDNREAQYELGCKLRWGNLLPLNVARANYWLERAANGGYAEAQHELACYYDGGQYGYPVDSAAAMLWYQRAFDQEYPETVYWFALRLFKNGKPTEAALELLRNAADQGFKQAEHVLRSSTH